LHFGVKKYFEIVLKSWLSSNWAKKKYFSSNRGGHRLKSWRLFIKLFSVWNKNHKFLKSLPLSAPRFSYFRTHTLFSKDHFSFFLLIPYFSIRKNLPTHHPVITHLLYMNFLFRRFEMSLQPNRNCNRVGNAISHKAVIKSRITTSKL
jgi:hypothetical protein